MSELKYCQGPKCHMYDTLDRKKGPKNNKRNETRRRSSFYYLGGNACSLNCANDWFARNGDQAVEHFGSLTAPRVLTEANAWQVRYRWDSGNAASHYVYNYLTREQRDITEQQYDNRNTITDDGRLNI